MSRKRQNTSSAEPESSPPKRRRSASNQSSGLDDEDLDINYEQPRVDARTGLAGAFPGLIDDPNGGLFYGPAEDGLDYLRMVRSEAKSIPNLLTAAKPVVQTDDHGTREDEDYEGFFDGDEAVVAKPTLPQGLGTTLSKAQLLYYESMLAKFNTLRAKMRAVPPLTAVQALSESTPVFFPPTSKIAKDNWQTFILQNPAHPVQVACMDPDSILELIRLMTRKMRGFLRSPEANSLQNIATWFWACLARCPDRGELGGEEIADLRSCAKMADETWHWLQTHGEDMTLNSTISDEDSECHEDVNVITDEGLRGVNHENQLRTSQENPKVNRLNDAGGPNTMGKYPALEQRMIIDMIITVVGETYGQRDLLHLRRPWASLNEG